MKSRRANEHQLIITRLDMTIYIWLQSSVRRHLYRLFPAFQYKLPIKAGLNDACQLVKYVFVAVFTRR